MTKHPDPVDAELPARIPMPVYWQAAIHVPEKLTDEYRPEINDCCHSDTYAQYFLVKSSYSGS